MRYLNAGLRFMLGLSYEARLGIVLSSGLICLLLYMLLFDTSYGALFLTIPIALAAWLFKRRGALICLAGIIAVMLLFAFIYDTDLFRSDQLLFFCFGCLALLIEGLLIGSLRELVDLSDEARQQIAVVYEQQQQLISMKDQFILNVNHELRTPLTAVYGYLELLLEHNEQLDPATRATFLKNAMYSSEELQLLVSNVLDTIRIGEEKNNLYVEEIPVADVVHEVIEHFDPRRQQEHAIQMYVPAHLVVRANAQFLRQVLRNLLSNATKYTPVDTPIVVSANLYGSVVSRDHPSPEVCIIVRDYGPGIPPDDIPLLFGQFARLRRDISGKVRGTGLGLYVSKQLIEAMDGRIWVESSGVPGEGSKFCFTLPCVTRAQVAAKADAGAFSLANFQSSFAQPSQKDKGDV